MNADVCCLSNICKKQTRECKAEPTDLDGLSTESSEISKKSLDASESK